MQKVFSRKNLFMTMILSVLCLALLFASAACDNTGSPDESETGTSASTASALWANAAYKEDTEFGSGGKTVKVQVKADGNSVIFTVHTDKSTLGDALLEHHLIAGEESQYGLYVKSVNGITADYDTDKAYWGFYKDGQLMNTGVDATQIGENENYELVYTKE